MKSSRALALIALAAASTFVQAEEQTVTVSATILNTCLFHESFSTLAFPSIDPSSTNGEKSVSNTFKFSCTKDQPVNFTVEGINSGSLNRELAHETDTSAKMAYAVSWTTPPAIGTGHSTANWISVPLSATLSEAAYRDAKGGRYTDEIRVVLAP